MAAIKSTYWPGYFSAWYWPPLYWPVLPYYYDPCLPFSYISGVVYGVVPSGLALDATMTADWYGLDVSDLNLGVVAAAYGDITVEIEICH